MMFDTSLGFKVSGMGFGSELPWNAEETGADCGVLRIIIRFVYTSKEMRYAIRYK